MQIEIESNIDKKAEAFSALRVTEIKEARISGLNLSGFLVAQAMRKWIESQGDGTWPKTHPLSQIWRKEKSGKWTHRREHRAYEGLGKFARYVVNPSAIQAAIGFGTFSGKKQTRFSPLLMKISEEAQKKRTVIVTQKMRRKLGAQRRSEKEIPGKDIFPIRGNTSVLEIAARPIAIPVFRKIEKPAGTAFSEKFGTSLKKRFDNL